MNQINLRKKHGTKLTQQVTFKTMISLEHQKLEKINQAKDEYLNDSFVDENIQVLEKSYQSQIIDQLIESISKNMEIYKKNIISSKSILNFKFQILNLLDDLYKKQSANENLLKKFLKLYKNKIKNLNQMFSINFMLKLTVQLVMMEEDFYLQQMQLPFKFNMTKKINSIIQKCIELILEQKIQGILQMVMLIIIKHILWKNYKNTRKLLECDEVIKLDSKNSEAYNSEGNQLYNLTRYDEVIIQYQQIIQLNPKSSIAHYNKGNTYNELKRYHEAIEMFDLSNQIRCQTC